MIISLFTMYHNESQELHYKHLKTVELPILPQIDSIYFDNDSSKYYTIKSIFFSETTISAAVSIANERYEGHYTNLFQDK